MGYINCWPFFCFIYLFAQINALEVSKIALDSTYFDEYLFIKFILI